MAGRSAKKSRCAQPSPPRDRRPHPHRRVRPRPGAPGPDGGRLRGSPGRLPACPEGASGRGVGSRPPGAVAGRAGAIARFAGTRERWPVGRAWRRAPAISSVADSSCMAGSPSQPCLR